MKVVCLSGFVFRDGVTDTGDIIDVTQEEMSQVYNRVAPYVEPKKEEKKTTVQNKVTTRKAKVDK